MCQQPSLSMGLWGVNLTGTTAPPPGQQGHCRLEPADPLGRERSDTDIHCPQSETELLLHHSATNRPQSSRVSGSDVSHTRHRSRRNTQHAAVRGVAVVTDDLVSSRVVR